MTEQEQQQILAERKNFVSSLEAIKTAITDPNIFMRIQKTIDAYKVGATLQYVQKCYPITQPTDTLKQHKIALIKFLRAQIKETVKGLQLSILTNANNDVTAEIYATNEGLINCKNAVEDFIKSVEG